jgi:hypothetical protein
MDVVREAWQVVDEGIRRAFQFSIQPVAHTSIPAHGEKGLNEQEWQRTRKIPQERIMMWRIQENMIKEKRCVLPAFANNEEVLFGRKRNAVCESEPLHQHRRAPRTGIEIQHPTVRTCLQDIQVPGMHGMLTGCVREVDLTISRHCHTIGEPEFRT